jgi:hypothetical protein
MMSDNGNTPIRDYTLFLVLVFSPLDNPKQPYFSCNQHGAEIDQWLQMK